MWKDFFYFSRNERRGVIVLIVLIVVVCGIAWFLPDRDTPSAHLSRDLNEEYADFVESLQEVKKEQKQYSRYPKATVKTEINYTTFDPNTADSITLLQLGLPGWMIKNIFRYRAKGGRFKTTEDFAKVYG